MRSSWAEDDEEQQAPGGEEEEEEERRLVGKACGSFSVPEECFQQWSVMKKYNSKEKERRKLSSVPVW